MKTKILSIIMICLVTNHVFAQRFCGTSPNYPNILAGTTTTKTVNSVITNLVVNNCTGITVNLRFHIIRNTNGTGGYPTTVVNTILNNLSNVYNKWGIYFVTNNPTPDIISNDTYSLNSNWATGNCGNVNFNNLIQVNRDNTAINIYILDANTWDFGSADGIPGRAIVIGGKDINGSELVPSLAMAHELGHCLNLFHTFHGCERLSCGTMVDVCLELPDGTNGTTCGDFIADTPADPAIEFNVTNCVWNKTIVAGKASCIAPGLTVNSYNPDATNIMTYVPVNCMRGFTEGQANRMRTELLRVGSILGGIRTTFNNVPDLATNNNITLNGNIVTGPTVVNNGSYNLIVPIQSSPNPTTYAYSVVAGSGAMVATINSSSGGNCSIGISGGAGSRSIRIVTSNACGSVSRDIVLYKPSAFRVSPNPTKSTLTVEFDYTEMLEALPDQMEIISEKTLKTENSINLKEIFDKKAFREGNKVDFDISALPRGTYYLRATNSREEKSKQAQTTRLIFE